MFSCYCIFEAEITSISFINSFLFNFCHAGIGTPLFFPYRALVTLALQLASVGGKSLLDQLV